MTDDEYTPPHEDILTPAPSKQVARQKIQRVGFFNSIGGAITERFRAVRLRMKFREQRDAMRAFDEMREAYEQLQKRKVRVSREAIADLQEIERAKIKHELQEAHQKLDTAAVRSSPEARELYRQQVWDELKAEADAKRQQREMTAEELKITRAAALQRAQDEKRQAALASKNLRREEIKVDQEIAKLRVKPKDVSAELAKLRKKSTQLTQRWNERKQQRDYGESEEKAFEVEDQLLRDAIERLENES